MKQRSAPIADGEDSSYLPCDGCGREGIDVVAAIQPAILGTKIKYSNDELDTGMVEHDEFDTMPVVFDIKNPMAARIIEDEAADDDNDNTYFMYSPPLSPSHSHFPPLMKMSMSGLNRSLV